MAKGELYTAIQLHVLTNSARFVEFETAGDLKVAVDKLDNQDFKGASVRCLADVCFLSDVQSAPRLSASIDTRRDSPQ